MHPIVKRCLHYSKLVQVVYLQITHQHTCLLERHLRHWYTTWTMNITTMHWRKLQSGEEVKNNSIRWRHHSPKASWWRKVPSHQKKVISYLHVESFGRRSALKEVMPAYCYEVMHIWWFLVTVDMLCVTLNVIFSRTLALLLAVLLIRVCPLSCFACFILIWYIFKIYLI
jgi:hypothetical protein